MSLLYDEAPAQAEAVPVDNSPGQFQTSLRSGFEGYGGQLNQFAGGAAHAAGADEVARGRFAEAKRLQEEAAAHAPRVASYKDVVGPDVASTIRNGYDYLTGLAGQSVPGVVVGLGGAVLGRTPVGKVLTSAAALTPGETGDVLSRQENTPEGMDFGKALATGAGSAAVQAVVPGTVASKLAAPAASAAKRSIAATIAGEVGENAGMGAATTAGSEALKQVGSGNELDPEAIKEAAVGGGVAGAGMGAVGAAGELAKKAATAPGNAAKAAGGSIADKVRGVFEDKAGKDTDAAQRMANGEDVVDPGALAGMDVNQVKQAMPGLDADRVARAKAMAEDVMTKAGVSPEMQDRVKAAAVDLTDRANQAVVAGAKLATDAGQALADKASEVYKAFKNRPVDVDAKVVTDVPALAGPKKSEDYAGLRQAISDYVLPALPKYALEGMNKEGQTAAINQVADSLRMLIERNAAGTPVDDIALRKLTDIFGDKTLDVLEGVHRAVSNTPDPAEVERFAGTLNRIVDMQSSDDALAKVMKSNLVDGVSANDAQLKAVSEHLRDYALNGPSGTEQAKLHDYKVRFELSKFFGDKADVVLAAVEKDVKASQKASRPTADENHSDLATQLSEREHAVLAGDTVLYGRKNGRIKSKDGEDSRGFYYDGLSLHPDHDPAGEKGQAVQALARATKENPDRSVSFIGAKELGDEHPSVIAKREELIDKFRAEGMETADAEKAAAKEVQKYGVVAAEGSRTPTEISKDDLAKIAVKPEEGKAKTSHYEGALKAEGGQAFDPVRLTKLMESKFQGEYTRADDKTNQHRTGRMFMEGVAALQDHLGKTFEIPDTTRIDGRGTTWGDVKKLDYSPREGKGAAEHAESYLNYLRKLYKGAKADGVNDKGLREIERKAARAKEKAEGVRDKELSRERGSKDETTDDTVDEGKPRTDPFGNVHEAGKDGNPEPIHTDLAGNSTKKSDAPIEGRLKPEDITTLRAKFDKMAETGAPGKAIADKGHALLDNADVLNKSAHRDMLALLNRGTRPTDAASTVNALTKKYANQFKPAEKAAAPKYEGKDKSEAGSYGALEGRDVTVKVPVLGKDGTYKQAEYTRDAAAYMRELDDRASALDEVRKCLG